MERRYQINGYKVRDKKNNIDCCVVDTLEKEEFYIEDICDMIGEYYEDTSLTDITDIALELIEELWTNNFTKDLGEIVYDYTHPGLYKLFDEDCTINAGVIILDSAIQSYMKALKPPCCNEQDIDESQIPRAKYIVIKCATDNKALNYIRSFEANSVTEALQQFQRIAYREHLKYNNKDNGRVELALFNAVECDSQQISKLNAEVYERIEDLTKDLINLGVNQMYTTISIDYCSGYEWPVILIVNDTTGYFYVDTHFIDYCSLIGTKTLDANNLVDVIANTIRENTEASNYIVNLIKQHNTPGTYTWGISGYHLDKDNVALDRWTKQTAYNTLNRGFRPLMSVYTAEVIK